MHGNMLKGHLDLLLLSVLHGGELHGYGVIQALRERSGGAFDLPEGTVYPALRRLEQSKHLRSRWQTVSGRRRRVYSLTAAGKRAMGREVQVWEAFSGAVSRLVQAPSLVLRAQGGVR